MLVSPDRLIRDEYTRSWVRQSYAKARSAEWARELEKAALDRFARDAKPTRELEVLPWAQ